MLLVLLGCTAPTRPAPPPPPDACAIMRTPAPGPKAVDIAQRIDRPIEVARLRVEEARLTGDPGFYTLAEQALDCAQKDGSDDPEAVRLRAHVLVQFHQFAEAERLLLPLAQQTESWQDRMLLGDALMEQGKLTDAAVAYQKAMDARPGLPLYDRAGWLRWLTGDLPGAIEMQQLAVQAGSPTDPEPFAWVLTRLGWLHALSGAPSPELDAALRLIPDYKPALFARGRVRLHAGDPAAASDLTKVGATVEAVWALTEIDPAANVHAVGAQDPRGYAMYLSDKEPERAVALLKEELTVRQDAVTHVAHAYASFRAGATADAAAEARAALGTGIIEPRTLLQGGLLLQDPALLKQALAMGPGLLPSERRQAEDALKSN